MTSQDWWFDSPANLLTALAGAAALYAVLILASRISGLRAYSKMSGFDFPLTVAVGSLLAATILTPDPPLVRSIVLLAGLLLMQAAVAWVRSRFESVRSAMDDKPLLLVRHGKLLENNIRQARVAESEIRAKLREANALSLSAVHAVILETTGDVSVLHGDVSGGVDDWIMSDVRGWES